MRENLIKKINSNKLVAKIKSITSGYDVYIVGGFIPSIILGKEITDIANIDGIPYGPTGLYPTNYDATPNKVDIGCTFFYGEAKAVNSADKLCTTWAKLKDISD